MARANQISTIQAKIVNMITMMRAVRRIAENVPRKIAR
jgi:hypothetical protein